MSTMNTVNTVPPKLTLHSTLPSFKDRKIKYCNTYYNLEWVFGTAPKTAWIYPHIPSQNDWI